MKHYTKHIILNSNESKEIFNITGQVESIVRDSGINEGLCLVNSMHTTSAIFINEDEAGLKQDLLHIIEKIVPDDLKYKHFGDNNAHSHLRSMLMGRGVTIAITNHRLDLGTWEQIIFLELDGPRNRKVLVKIIGE